MTTFTRRLLVLSAAAIAIVSWGLSADQPPAPAGVVALADAERAFARLSVEQGVRHSFLENFAADGVGFFPEPMIVRTALAKAPPPPPDRPRAVLDWYPVLSDLAASGELGFNLGPSLRTPPPGDAAKPKHGYFFSVWKRQADSRFKVVLDMGIDTGGPLPADTPANWRPLRSEPWRAKAGVSIEDEVESLEGQEEALGKDCAARGALAAYSRVLAADFRLFEDGSPPVVDHTAAPTHLAALGQRGRRRFEPRHTEVAQSRDFGYSWGAYRTEPADGQSAERGYYGHVWRRDAGGRWRLAIEVIRPQRAP
jgi:ketosteroid isomerase-like protein